jgi:copper/silver efflux system protein
VATISLSRGPAMIRDEDGQLTGYVYIDLNTTDYGSFVSQASNVLRQNLQLPAGCTYEWSGEYEFQLRAKERLKIRPSDIRAEFRAARHVLFAQWPSP